MSIYAIGDVQGCFYQLKKLLEKIKFDEASDELWFTGDLVNRGPNSLEVLRFVKSLGTKQKLVLGNHDLHLLALFYGKTPNEKDTLQKILSAEDADELMQWLRTQPLLHYDKTSNFALVHAGLAPAWTIEKALSLAQEVENVLRGDDPQYFILQMYGDRPAKWNDKLTGVDRLRCIVNYFTRMRYCYADGSMDLKYKGKIVTKPNDLIPWFEMPERKNKEVQIVFGHWAALGGYTDEANLFPLDTGCVWGNCLTALRLDDGVKFSVQC